MVVSHCGGSECLSVVEFPFLLSSWSSQNGFQNSDGNSDIDNRVSSPTFHKKAIHLITATFHMQVLICSGYLGNWRPGNSLNYNNYF